MQVALQSTLPRAGAMDASTQFYQSLKRLENWIERHDYEAYEPFDGLSTPLRRLTFGNLFFDRLLMQAVRQSPINVRPFIGIKPLPSTKGRGYMAAGYLTMYQITGEPEYRAKAIACLDWLITHKSPMFTEYSWANHFDFASRAGRYSKDESIIVWTALIGDAFVDAYETIGDSRYLEVAESACRWILSLPRERYQCRNVHQLPHDRAKLDSQCEHAGRRDTGASMAAHAKAGISRRGVRSDAVQLHTSASGWILAVRGGCPLSLG